jgi:3-oxoacyl-[acyl-carrier protein] reductase
LQSVDGPGSARVNPGRRWSVPTGTARLAAWLLSDADGVTGQTIVFDGGWSSR